MVDLDELERLNAERTQGEWEWSDDDCDITCDGSIVAFVQPHGSVRTVLATGEEFSHADARAIVAAVNFLPHLLRIARAAERYREAHDAYFGSRDDGDGYEGDRWILFRTARGELFAALDAAGGGK